MKPNSGHLLLPLEAERVELEHGAAVFGVLKNSHSVVGGAAVGKQQLNILENIKKWEQNVP